MMALAVCDAVDELDEFDELHELIEVFDGIVLRLFILLAAGTV